MPLIQITLGAGPTPEQKRELLAGVTRVAAESTGYPLSAIRAWIVEVPATELMIAGETLAERNARE